MSRSANTERPSNPALRFIEWQGSEGHFYYYDKNATNPNPAKNGANVTIPLPFAFLVLDQLATITGWSDADQSGIWSNEVRNIKTEILSIRTKKGLQIEGTYENVKGKVSGADYTKTVYVGFFDENKALQIGCIKMAGAALNAWIEFAKGKNVCEGAIRVDSFSEGQKGAVKYKMPVFTAFNCKPETNDAAVELDKKLQEYLKEYFAYNSAQPAETEVISHNRTSEANQPNNDFIPEAAMPEKSAKEIIAEKKAVAPPMVDQYKDLPDDF